MNWIVPGITIGSGRGRITMSPQISSGWLPPQTNIVLPNVYGGAWFPSSYNSLPWGNYNGFNSFGYGYNNNPLFNQFDYGFNNSFNQFGYGYNNGFNNSFNRFGYGYNNGFNNPFNRFGYGYNNTFSPFGYNNFGHSGLYGGFNSPFYNSPTNFVAQQVLAPLFLENQRLLINQQIRFNAQNLMNMMNSNLGSY